MKIYESEETLVGQPVVVTATDDQICVVIKHADIRRSALSVLPREEALKLALAITERLVEPEPVKED